jgi:predicted nucleic acid-binding protein
VPLQISQNSALKSLIPLTVGPFSGAELSNSGSQITRMELPGFAGLNDAEEQAARAFLSAFQVVGITAEIEDKAIRLRRSGALKLPDAIVAATALSTGAALLTLDQRLSRVVEAQRRLHAR